MEDLIRFAATRDPELRNALAIRHLPLAKFVARKMSSSLPSHIDLDDLVSWGSIGLLDAIDKFDPSRQVRFSTYAVTRIRGAILDGLQQMDWAPKQVTSRVRAVRRVKEILTNELGTEPTVAQLAVHMEVPDEVIRGWLVDDLSTHIRPLDVPRAGGDDTDLPQFELSDRPAQEVAGEVAEIRAQVAVAIRTLGKRERAVFLLYYRDSLTLREIAEALGVSVSSATQTHTRLVEQIRDRLATLGGVA